MQPALEFRFHVMRQFELAPQAPGHGVIRLDRDHVGIRSGDHFHIALFRHCGQSAGGSFLPGRYVVLLPNGVLRRARSLLTCHVRLC